MSLLVLAWSMIPLPTNNAFTLITLMMSSGILLFIKIIGYLFC